MLRFLCLASNLPPNKIASLIITAQKDQDHSTKESMQASISEDALAALQKKGQQASTSARGLYYPSKVQTVFTGFLFFSGWGRNFFCTRDDCTTQLQWWKSCQVCFSEKRQKVRNDWFRAPSERLLLGDWTSQRSYGTCSGGASNWTSFTEWVQQPDRTCQHIQWIIHTVCISFFEHWKLSTPCVMNTLP